MNLRSYTAGDLMTKNVCTIDGTASLREAVAKMHSERVQGLIVPPRNKGDGYGIITVKDIIGLIDTEGDDDDVLAELADMAVVDAMTRPVICTQEGLGAHDCTSLMRMTGVRRLIVLRGEEMVGILSYTDIFNLIAQPSAQPV